MLKLAPLLALLLLLDHGHMDNFLWTVRDKNVDNMFSVEMMCTFLLLNCRNVDNFFDGHRHRNFNKLLHRSMLNPSLRDNLGNEAT